MCPLCIATGSLLLSGAGAGSAGAALAAVATRVLRRKERRKQQSDEAADVGGSTQAGTDLTHSSTQPAPQ
jgi:hypothetical protein